MNAQLTAYISLVCVSGVLNVYLSLYVFFKRHHYTNIARFFILHAVCITIYCIGAAFGLMATTIQEIKMWTVVQYIGMPFSAVYGLLFVMQYLGVQLSRKKVAVLLFIPFITLIMVATNDLHHFHYRVYEVDPVLGAPFVRQEIGVWYIIHGIFTFASLFAALLLPMFQWKETARVYRPQLLSLMCGQLVPIVTAFIYLIGLTPPGFDPVPMVLWMSSLFYLWSISSSRLFTILPVAKDSIFHSINDGVMVLDESRRLIEFNRGCEKMFPRLTKSMFGMDFEKVWFKLSENSFPFHFEAAEQNQELTLMTGAAKHTYQIRTTPLQHANQIHGRLLIFTDITELKELQMQLEHQAYYDELTQVQNRRAFFKQAEDDFAEALNESKDYTVVLLDIDYFKKVNDTYGHHIGDCVLQHVAKVCQSQLNEGDVFARYGGEEFVLALKGCSAAEGRAAANRMRVQIEQHPLEVDGHILAVTASLGVAEAAKGPGETLTQLLNKADHALYQAKNSGRNQVGVYDDQENAALNFVKEEEARSGEPTST